MKTNGKYCHKIWLQYLPQEHSQRSVPNISPKQSAYYICSRSVPSGYVLEFILPLTKCTSMLWGLT
jgi:hypothetical protein